MTLSSSQALASQAAFRALMDAFARPGDIKPLDGVSAPAPLAPAAAALIQSLVDYETPVWLDTAFAAASAVADWIRFHTGARITHDMQEAGFALVADPMQVPDLTRFALGSEEYPDRSTTLILQIERFAGRAFNLTGPGIETARTLHAEPLPADFAERLAANRELFPRGIDLVLVAGNELAALPRSLRVTAEA